MISHDVRNTVTARQNRNQLIGPLLSVLALTRFRALVAHQTDLTRTPPGPDMPGPAGSHSASGPTNTNGSAGWVASLACRMAVSLPQVRPQTGIPSRPSAIQYHRPSRFVRANRSHNVLPPSPSPDPAVNLAGWASTTVLLVRSRFQENRNGHVWPHPQAGQ